VIAGALLLAAFLARHFAVARPGVGRADLPLRLFR